MEYMWKLQAKPSKSKYEVMQVYINSRDYDCLDHQDLILCQEIGSIVVSS